MSKNYLLSKDEYLLINAFRSLSADSQKPILYIARELASNVQIKKKDQAINDGKENDFEKLAERVIMPSKHVKTPPTTTEVNFSEIFSKNEKID